MCVHQIFCTEYGTNLCLKCGIERRCGLDNRPVYSDSQPIFDGYSRRKRFRGMLMKVFQPLRFNTVNGEVSHFLNKFTVTDIAHLVSLIKLAPTPHKCYNSLHMYSIIHIPNHASPVTPIPAVVESIITHFQRIENTFSGSTRRFFSYRWLLRKLLVESSCEEFCVYVMPLKNKRSQQVYEKLYQACLK